ncbi:phosphatase PAP2 family protein [Nocardiopsis sp. FIRDI 009]|uniref:phosphatase PAP2 family protein n=1 Tax=Nocardiopsis sp. FIRDI 009 TaxID=714197 RepID=UPI000E246C20|nr:phosphatase PAP2 family protein [Nocardiopsis sp. FIRDI 009]
MNAWTPEHLAVDALWEAETTPILWVQGWGDWLAPPLGLVTELGSQTFVVLLLTLVFWCVNAGTGARLFVAVVASGAVNYLLKALVYGARPFWFSPQVTAHATESTFGIPSGHAQLSTVLWGYLGLRSGSRAWLGAAAALVALVCLSRVYLGVHFFSDVLAGLLVGVAVLWTVLRWEERVLRWWRGLSTAAWAGCAVAVSVLPCVAAAAWQGLVRADWSAPTEWMGAVPADPAGATLTGLSTVCGALLGGLVGFTLLHGRGWYSAEGTLTARAARFVLGISVVVLLQVADDLLLGGLTGWAEAAAAFVVYVLIALWASFGAPETFVRSGLARRPEPVGATGGGAAHP